MTSQPPPPPGQGRVPLPSASMARPQLKSWAPSPLDEPEPLPIGSQPPLSTGQIQRPSTNVRASNSPTAHLQSARAGGASQLPSYSQSANYQTPPSLGQSNRPASNTPTGYSQSGRPIQPSSSSLGQHMQSQRAPSSLNYQNVGQSQSQRVPSNSQLHNVTQSQSQSVPPSSHYQNVGQGQSQRLPSNPPYQTTGQGNIGISISSSKFSNGQLLDPPGHTGMPTIPEMASLQSSRLRSESLSRTSTRSSSRGPTAQGGVSVMAPKLDMTKRGDGKSHMPSQLDLTKSQILMNAPPPNAPKNQPSILRSKYDISMASKKVNFASLSGMEQEEVDAWAQKKLQALGDGCKEGWKWIKRDGGYQCKGGAHAVTDALFEEGKGGLYTLKDRTWNWDIENIKGPYYKDENGDWVRNTENDPPKKV